MHYKFWQLLTLKNTKKLQNQKTLKITTFKRLSKNITKSENPKNYKIQKVTKKLNFCHST